MSGPFKVSANYIDWAHSPSAEDVHPLTIDLCDLADRPNRRGQAEIPVDRLDLVLEIIDVAELFVGGDDTDLRAARALKRAKAYLAEFPRHDREAARAAWRSGVNPSGTAR